MLMQILIKNGTYNDMMTAALIASGAVAVDIDVQIFAMNDAVWAFKKDVVGTDRVVSSQFPAFIEKMAEYRAVMKPYFDAIPMTDEEAEGGARRCSRPS